MRESDCSLDVDVDLVPLASSGRFLCLWTIPSFSYLARSFLKLDLVLNLVEEEFPESLGVPVRPVWGPVRPPCGPVRPPCGPVRPFDAPVWPVRLLPVLFSLCCPPSVELFATTWEVLFYGTPFSCLSSPTITFFPLADSAWCGRINTFRFDNSSVWTGKGIWSICIAGITNRLSFMADCICLQRTLQSSAAEQDSSSCNRGFNARGAGQGKRTR